MTRRRVGWIFLGVVAAALLASFSPDLRLAVELAGARRDGLWASIDEMIQSQKPLPAEVDAAPRVDALYIEEEKINWANASTNRGLYEALHHTMEGSSTVAERNRARAWIDRHSDLLRGWRDASHRPRLGSGVEVVLLRRRFWKGDRIVWGFDRLLVASALGIDAHENLLAASRLGNLARQTAGVGSKLVVSGYLGEILRQARSQGMEKEAEAALGPPIDFHEALRGGMAEMLESMDGEWEDRALRKPIWKERLRRTSSQVALSKLGVVQSWRGLWNGLPSDPEDYEGAAAVLDRSLPKIEADLQRHTGRVECFLYQSSGRPGDWLRQIGRAETERRKIREGR